MNRINTLIFDFGGVIVNLNRAEAVRRFEQLGLADADSRLDVYRQQGIFNDIEDGRLDKEGFVQALSSLCGHPLEEKEVQYAWLGFFQSLQPGRLSFIQQLRRLYRVFVLSNTNPFVWEYMDSPSFTKEGLPVSAFFDRLYTSFQLGYTKPSAEIFRAILTDAGIHANEALFIDDGRKNIEAAAALGFHTLLVENGGSWESALSRKLEENV